LLPGAAVAMGYPGSDLVAVPADGEGSNTCAKRTALEQQEVCDIPGAVNVSEARIDSEAEECKPGAPQDATSPAKPRTKAAVLRKDSSCSDNLASFLEAKKQRDKKVTVPKDMLHKMKRAFKEMDKDGDGFLTIKELREALEVKMPARNRALVNEVLGNALTRVDKDGDGQLDYDEFLELALDGEPGFFVRHKLKIQGILFLSFFAVSPLMYCTLNTDEGQWSVWDALYFAAVTVTTVGYGDFGPSNDGMKVFTMFYILFGLAIVARMVDEAVSMMIQYYEEKMKSFNKKLASTATEGSKRRHSLTRTLSDLTMFCGSCGCGPEMCSRQVRMKLLTSTFLFTLPLMIGTIFFALNEEWPWLHALYWSIVTCTTVGYGDLTLEKESSRIFSIFFVLAGFALVGAAIGNIGALRVELAMERQKKELLSKSLSLDMIADMDRDGNGVDKCEFVCAMLLQMNKVAEEDLIPLFTKFEELDADGSGVLTSEDLEMLRARKRSSWGRGSPGELEDASTCATASTPPKCALTPRRAWVDAIGCADPG